LRYVRFYKNQQMKKDSGLMEEYLNWRFANMAKPNSCFDGQADA